jgi:hypothetical protein
MISLKKLIFVVTALSFVTEADFVRAGNIRIKNKTSLEFTHVIVDYERNEGRQTRAYKTEPYDANKINKTDTLPYRSTLRLRDGVCKLTFIAADSLCKVYAVNTAETKKLVLNDANTSVKLNYGDWIMVSSNVRLFFDFVNSSDYTVYDIYPEYSDGGKTFDRSILYNTDQRLVPGERRKIFVDELHKESVPGVMDVEYYDSISMEFEIYAADKEGRLKRGLIRLVNLTAEEIVISNSVFDR